MVYLHIFFSESNYIVAKSKKPDLTLKLKKFVACVTENT